MAYVSYDNIWRSEFYNNVSAKDRVQAIDFNQMKFKVNVTYETDKIKTKFEAVNNEDVMNKAYPDTKKIKNKGHFSHIEKDLYKFNLHNNTQSIEEILIERAVKTTIQIFSDKALFDNYKHGNAYEVLKDFLFVGKCRPNLVEEK